MVSDGSEKSGKRVSEVVAVCVFNRHGRIMRSGTKTEGVAVKHELFDVLVHVCIGELPLETSRNGKTV